MVQLPGGSHAVLDIRKLEEYCLNPSNYRGRHKARVFRRALGIGQSEADWLGKALLAGARTCEAVEHTTDGYGTRWRMDVPVARQGKTAVIRTVWIVHIGESVPRFVTCWVL